MPALRLHDPGRAVRQALLLLGVSTALAATLWIVRPDRLALTADPQRYLLDLQTDLIPVDDALAAYEAGTYFVDTRPGDPEGRATIPYSFVIREAHLEADLEALDGFLLPEDELVLFGEDHPLPVDAVGARLAILGFENLAILEGGFAAWRAAGGEVDGGDPAREGGR